MKFSRVFKAVHHVMDTEERSTYHSGSLMCLWECQIWSKRSLQWLKWSSVEFSRLFLTFEIQERDQSITLGRERTSGNSKHGPWASTLCPLFPKVLMGFSRGFMLVFTFETQKKGQAIIQGHQWTSENAQIGVAGKHIGGDILKHFHFISSISRGCFHLFPKVFKVVFHFKDTWGGFALPLRVIDAPLEMPKASSKTLSCVRMSMAEC